MNEKQIELVLKSAPAFTASENLVSKLKSGISIAESKKAHGFYLWERVFPKTRIAYTSVLIFLLLLSIGYGAVIVMDIYKKLYSGSVQDGEFIFNKSAGDAQSALEELNREIALNPDDLLAHEGRISALCMLDRADEALKYYQSYAESSPDNAQAYYLHYEAAAAVFNRTRGAGQTLDK